MFAPLTLAAASFFLSDRMWLDRNCVLLVAWAVAAWIAEALPGHLFPHYFQYWLPFWCVIGGAAAAALADKHAGPKLFRRGVIFIAFAVAAIRQCSQLRLTPDQWADTKYPGGNYTQQKYLGRYLKEHVLKPRDTFWVAGDDASLYLEACVSPPTGLLYVDPLIGGPHTADYNRRLVSDLTAHPPALILLTPLIERFPADAPIFEFILDRYRPWSTTIGGRMYHVYIRD